MNKLDSYGYNVMFSWINSTTAIPVDLSEYKSVKSGIYKKALKNYFSTYNSKAEQNKYTVGSLFDLYI